MSAAPRAPASSSSSTPGRGPASISSASSAPTTRGSRTAACPSGVDVGGKKLPSTPDYNATVGMQLSRAVRTGWSLYGRAEMAFYGEFQYDDANTAAQDAYSLGNFRAGVRCKGLDVAGLGQERVRHALRAGRVRVRQLRAVRIRRRTGEAADVWGDGDGGMGKWTVNVYESRDADTRTTCSSDSDQATCSCSALSASRAPLSYPTRLFPNRPEMRRRADENLSVRNRRRTEAVVVEGVGREQFELGSRAEHARHAPVLARDVDLAVGQRPARRCSRRSAAAPVRTPSRRSSDPGSRRCRCR